MLLSIAMEHKVLSLPALWFVWYNFMKSIYWHISNLCSSIVADDQLGSGVRNIRPGISPNILAELTDCNTALSQQRKKRQVLFMLPFISLVALISLAEASIGYLIYIYSYMSPLPPSSLIKVLVKFRCSHSIYLTSSNCSLSFCIWVSIQISSTLASIDALERYTQISSHPLHKTSKPGILSIDIHHDKVWLCIYLLLLLISAQALHLYMY